MGNRAVIAFDASRNAPCIYLHWNGGRASVEGFLQAARELGLRRASTPEQQQAALNWLADQVGRSFFGNDVGSTIYREQYGRSDANNGDNGVYILGDDLQILQRRFDRPGREEIDAEKTSSICQQIVARSPIFND